MQITYTGRHTQITDEMKEYVEKRLTKLKFFSDQILIVDVILEIQRGQYTFEIKVKANHDFFIASDTESTWQKSIDLVTDKLEKSIRRKKERIKEHHAEKPEQV